MRVLIYGVNSKNKGAQLLLATTSAWLSEHGHQPVVSMRDVNADTRKELSMLPMVSVERLGAFRSFGWDQLPSTFIRHIKIVPDGAFDYVLDVSGFSMTDAWGMQPLTSRLGRLRRWKKLGIGYSMLPQAFGPFDNPGMAESAAEVFGLTDRIWARDKTSERYVKGVYDDHRKVSVAPDVTIGLAVDTTRTPKRDVIIVPNWNIGSRENKSKMPSYIDSLAQIIIDLTQEGRRITGLCHEGPNDLQILNAVAERTRGLEVLSPTSGMECKKVIAQSNLVVAGRYHAAVSALSSSVPVVAHSWSHKYEALMSDFEVEDGLADPFDPSSTMSRIQSLQLEKETSRLRVIHDSVKSRVDAMWTELNTMLP
ncbi:hypothetical protein RhoFasSB10_02883 [Rhodococcus fascians]|uniref:polysaccharide pyruvyl transferase family protein n=1 Tax=Rhodococcoides fascians TaxID=1828 RepID=UPI001427CECF|nr:hypothetical protein [Rhodococcus fascians]